MLVSLNKVELAGQYEQGCTGHGMNKVELANMNNVVLASMNNLVNNVVQLR